MLRRIRKYFITERDDQGSNICHPFYSGFDFTTIERVEFVGHQFNSNLKGNRSRLVGFYVDGGSANRREQRNQ
jgi:hypothetical protein